MSRRAQASSPAPAPPASRPRASGGGSAACGLGARRGAGEHERAVEARAARARDVGVEPVADREHARPAPSRSSAASYMAGSGLPTIASAVRPAAASTAARTAPVPGHGPSGIGNVRSRVSADQLGAAQHGLRGDRAARRSRSSSWPATTTTSAREANSVLLTIRSPASATWSTSACAPITNAAPPPRARASRYCSAAPTVTTSSSDGLEAEPPELAHELLGRVPDVVGEERDALAGLAQRGDGLAARARRLVADPQAAVEVEQDVVVAAGEGGERHGRSLSSPRMSRLPCRSRSCSPARCSLAACGGDDEETAPSDRDAETAPRRAAATGCEKVASAEAEGRRSPSRTGELDKGKTYVATRAHQLRRVRDHARRQARAEDRRLVQVRSPTRASSTARRFHRIVAGLRDPGRRPARQRHRRPRLLGRRGAAGGPQATPGRRGDGQDRRPSRPAPPAASSSSSPARTPGCRPTTRCSARSRRARTSSTRSASSTVGPTSSRSIRSSSARSASPNPERDSAPPAAMPPAECTAASNPGPSTSAPPSALPTAVPATIPMTITANASVAVPARRDAVQQRRADHGGGREQQAGDGQQRGERERRRRAASGRSPPPSPAISAASWRGRSPGHVRAP